MVLSTVSTVAITNSSNQIYNKGNKQWILSDCVEFWLRKHSNSVIAICIKTSATTTPQNQCAATEMSRALINLGIWSIKIHQCEILFALHRIELHYTVWCIDQKFPELFYWRMHFCISLSVVGSFFLLSRQHEILGAFALQTEYYCLSIYSKQMNTTSVQTQSCFNYNHNTCLVIVLTFITELTILVYAFT